MKNREDLYNTNESIAGIYIIKNIINGKVYIGLSKNIIKRLIVHYNSGNRDKIPNQTIYKAMKKYGIENFKWGILEEVENKNDRYNLGELEKKYISEYKSSDKQYGYNNTGGGDGLLLLNKDIIKAKADKVRGIKKPVNKPVYQFDLSFNLINSYPNLDYIHENTIYKKHNICQNLKGKTFRAYNFI